MSSSGTRSKQARLLRQASVLHELQETQEKDSLDGRYARLMTELAALCSDRSNVITADSLQFFASSGRAEPVKLERAPERADAQQKQSGGGSAASKQDDLLSADAARRQRVEELTRFFMEAKSDIEFALGGGRDFHEAKDKDKEAESERDEDKEDAEDVDEAQDDGQDPERQVAKLHAKLLKDKLDNRVYNVMLGHIREQDPALYGAILCHPLVTGVDPKKDKKKKKKRKDRERKEKQPSQSNVGAGMLTPDLTAEPLSGEEMKTNISRFVAKSIAEGSLQGLMLAAKLVLSFLDQQNKANNAAPPTFPLASHLRVMRGEKAPEYKAKKAAATGASATKEVSTPTKEVTTPTKADETMADTSALDSAGGNFETDLQSVVLETAASAEMDLDSDSGSIAKLRARLSRFGDDDEDDDNECGEGEDSLGGEGVDEDALMARAIALSLSPEVNLRDQNASGGAPSTPKSESKSDGAAAEPNAPPVVKTRPPKFSAEEMLELGPFTLPVDSILEVDGATVVMALIVQMTKPHPLTFMLLNSLLRDLHSTVAPHHRWAEDPSWVAKWRLFSSCSMLSLFRVLEVHFFHVEVMGVAPASVGLGQIPKLNHQQSDGASEGGNPLLESLKSLVLNYIAAESPSEVNADTDVIGAIIFSSLTSCSPVEVQNAAVYYYARVREQAMAVWIRAFAIFYGGQKERHMVLASKLAECLKLARSGEQKVEWKFHQLDLLCARLALPDMAQLFVPTCVDVIEHDSKIERGQNNQSGSDSSVKPIDDGALQNAASKTGNIKAKWSPAVIRASLDSGSLSARCLYDYISGHGPPGLLDAIMESPGGGPNDDALNADTLANAYDEMWDMGRKQKADALECINRLPSLLDLLRESILSAGWHNFSFKDSYELVHAPLLPLLEKDDGSLRPATPNARIVLLRSLQDLMIQRLGGSRGDEPPAVEFDSSRCAETMTLSDGNRTAKQYTAKQWGMVMATTGCPPNTGIHEWGVRLDRCEKGHIFLGVCTRDASVATYVGGDRQGWGLIGTRALWHARSKVRGDYGDGFTTGSVVRVRLNTDSGALSFGVGDSDWGIAFDGLTQHGTLYPAIGLYQRDDQVTILPVQPTVDTSFAASLGGEAMEPKGVAIPAVLKPFLHHAGALLESCCSFLSSPALNELSIASDQQSALTARQKIERARDYELLVSSYPLLFSMVTPLISSLSLIRNYHGLSSTMAMTFMPWCIRTMQCIERVNQALRALAPSIEEDDDVSPGSLVLSVAGEWELKSVAAGNIPAQQYHLTLSQGKDGSMQGRSSGSFTTVTLNGVARGTKVSFVETWRQGGTCLVEGRIRADGTVFTGSYEDTKSHTSGCIVGNKISQDTKDTDGRQWVSNQLVILEMVIANLLGYLGHALTSLKSDDLLVDNVGTGPVSLNDVVKGDEGDSDDGDMSKLASSDCSIDEYDEWVSSSLLEGGLPLDSVQTHLSSVLERCSDITGFGSAMGAGSLPVLTEATKTWMQFVLPKTLITPLRNTNNTPVSTASVDNPFLKDLIDNRGEAASLDRWVSKHVGESPFVRLGGESMKATRRTVCAAMIWHSGFSNSIMKHIDNSQSDFAESDIRPHDNLMHIWRAAQRVIEWAIRAKNSMGSSYTVVAGLVIRKAQFLLEIEPSAKALAAAEAVFALTTVDSGTQRIASKSAVYECAERIYSDVLVQVARFVEAPIRVSTLQSRMLGNCTAAFLRTIGMLSFRNFVGDSSSNHRGVLSAERHEVIQSSFALSSALQWLSPTLANFKANGGRGASLGKDFGDFGASVVPAAVTSSQASTTESTHYLSGLGGCGKHLKNDLRDSFESLYGYLSASLSKATWAHDADLQLVILLAWGIIIQPDDHSFLSRVGIFRVLQTVLDEARGSSDMTSAGTSSGLSRNSPDDAVLIAENKKKIVQAALKVVHLLAAQVAHASDTADGLLNASDLPSTPGLSLGSIPLLRKPSGPETLGKSVFHMLYTELKNSLEEMRQTRGNMAANAPPTAFVTDPTQSGDPSTSGSEADFGDGLDDAQEYCYQICSLLYSVSGSPVCRSHLSSSRWLRLLLALVDVNSPQIQRRILKLLRRLLPSLDPSFIRVRYDEVESFDMDSDDEYEADQDEPDHASTLINFFVGIVGMNNPPSVAEVMLRRRADSGSAEVPRQGAGSDFNRGGLGAEVVLLLRSLYESDKWAEYLNLAISDALASIPLECVTEQDRAVADTADSDVEMEDMSKVEPSLESWTTQTTSYVKALSALCILDGHIEGLHVGGTVKIMPRSGSSLQEIAFRGARGVIVAYEPEKSAAEVLLRGSRVDEANGQQQSLAPSRSIPTRPVRVPIDDLLAVPEVELPNKAFSDTVLKSLLVERFPYFLVEVKKCLMEVNIVDALNEADEDGENDGDSEDDDDMSNDGSSSPSAMDSEMPSGAGVESDSEANGSPRHQKNSAESASRAEPTDVMAEMEKESRLHRMLLCQHGLRAAATLLKNDHCAATFIRGVGPNGLKDLLTVAISETPTTAGVGDISSLEESWLMLWSRWYAIRSAHAAPSPPVDTNGGKNKANDAVVADNTSGPMVQQMMEMGFPKEWCDVALARCSQNVEAAINFCFEHSSDMERLVAEYRSSRGSGADGNSKSSRKDDFEAISPLLEQLSEMGFPFNWCKKALAANRNNVDAALTWILSNGEALEAEDRRDEETNLRASGGDAAENAPSAIPDGDDAVLMPNPLRAVSGQACIEEHDLMVEGLVGGGFASVGAPDCLVSSGRWYYEAILHTNGCIQIGWADVAFCGAADRGDGVGDGAHSWAYDGWRQQRWHGRSSPWGSKWKQGDVIGCGIDADAGTIIFSLNGKMRSANMGVAFRAIDFARGVYPCASFNRRERLQFNLGGSPFKYPPPPGFQPILNVLSDTYDLSSVPKGFDVIGSREDCLEESVGEETYSSDTRYFARDMHPSMLRSSGHNRSSGFASGSGVTKADALAEIKALPDNRVYVELLVVTRSLAILQARRALLTLLAKWPTSVVGSFSIATCLSGGDPLHAATEREDSARFVDFIKLIASLSALHVSNALPSTSLTLPDSDALHLLDCGATGRFALGLLSGVVQSALNSALATITSGACDRNPLVDTILSSISSEVKRASQRQYARIPWNTSEAAITATLLQITAEAGQTWSDKEVLNHPNLFLAEWISGLLLESLEEHKGRLSLPVHDQIRQQLLQAWVSSLKSPSMCVKERGATILAGILQDILPEASGIADETDIGCIDDETKNRLKLALDVLPLQRLVDLSQERILREYPNVPVCSKYVESLVELVSAAGLVMSAVGQSTDKLFESSSSLQLQACKRIEVDLEPIDQKEYEEVMAAKKLLQAQQAQQAADEALNQEKLAAERAAAAEAGVERDSSESLDEANAVAINGDIAIQNSEDDASSIRNSGVSNMEVDNSDSEEAPDITLSAIANMVTEDSDVMAATAAIAAASGDRLGIKGPGRRTKLPMPELLQEKPNATFEFRLPEKDPVFDTSMLNTHEIDVLEAAKRGIMREEPRGWKHGNDVGVLADSHTQLWSGTLTQFRLRQKQEETNQPELKVGCKVIRGPNWKWRDQDGGEGSVGVVEGVSPWSGVDGEGMSVRWPNDSLYTYRWGADGNFDLIHVEVDEEGNITHQHPTPKAKQEDEGSFGSELHLGVLLNLFVDENVTAAANAEAVKVAGLMEWPDYGAAVRVVGLRYPDGSLCVQELQLTRGNPDMGWMLRFGTEKWQPGTKYMLHPFKTPDSPVDDDTSKVDTLRGEYTHAGVKGGELVEIRGELQVSTKYLFTMDHYNHFSTLGISSDGLSVTCHNGESRNLALGTVGFTTGVHYWEVHIEQAEFGSVFIGVCEKAGPPGSQAALSSRLNRWHGWGFVNFRATYHNSTERIYGDHFNASDTIGVRLDMEQGKLSFFMDGIKFGEHIVSDLGVAFENMKGERNSRTLYPCIGMRKGGDRVTLNQKWISMPGVSARQILSDAVDVSKSLHSWYVSIQQGKTAASTGSSASGPSSPSSRGAEAMAFSTPTTQGARVKLPETLLRESWSEWKRWSDNHWQRCHVRPRGISVDFDTSPVACIRASNAAGLGAPFLAGDRVRMCSKCGQELNQPEEAVILGVYRGFLWYRTETQGNEGADEGRAWAWYWSPSELPELLLIRRGGKDMTLIENSAMDMSDYENAPEHSPFKPRSTLEERAQTDFDAFVELATRAHTTTSDMQLVERLNACCAAIGLDVTNLKITDVVTPVEMEDSSTNPVRGRSRTHSLVVDDYFTSPALKNISGAELRARTAVLRVLNSKILRVLPIIAIQPDDGSSTQSIEVAGTAGGFTKLSAEFLSTSLKLRSLRRLVFTSTKRAFWDDVLRATTTSTPLPSDEYEDPREIRVIRINRIQAQASKLSLLSQPGDRLRRSVFGQLYREMRAWSDSFFRRAYCGKGHGGQRRAFKVKFLGEGVNDYGGPYRAVFEQIVDELQMDNVELAKGEQGLLPLLIPCPNRRSATGINQDKFLLNPSCGTALLANGPMALDLHRFLGKLIGTAVRHGLQMGLDLPSLVWRPLAGLDVSRAHLESVDVAVANNLTRVEELSTDTEAATQEAEEVLGYLTLSTTLSDGVEVPLVPQGEKMLVTLENRELYVQLVEKTRLTESSQQLAALKDGLGSVLPMELAPLFTPRELEVLICGRREVDVDLLHQCTEYSEGADEAMPHVQHFWEVLRELTSEERTSFLRFVWARSRMPNSAKDFPMNFKLQTAQDPGASSQPDLYLPHAQTCFFALRLPAYTSKEVLRTKLLYAIQNSPNMDADVRLHNAEGWADA
ncbi:RING finger and SPRY domain-containing protein 1 [Phytophthora pseudosyringae]|uniref:RING finger and SPRY domain-containing protein 1 n=1 Tax=Phytophthora pseudosyringae TaxID=221518 RepID=A0A8T1WBC4_9STRA|nr:RING finger and SPRY domain-containing protein 1 [Phytophthora pseudosyringae]